ncbi:dihydrofolate reductase [Candidatus Kaiserbacteria bacterium]|nr:dihydrofolate reductase [Candidatus Kaiserbacteria bacterium]
MESKRPTVSMIVAIGQNRVIGKGNTLLWHLPDDLKHFKHLTVGHPCIMGRRTFESIVAMLKKPLPGRTNIVVTRDTDWHYDGVMVAHSLEEALQKAKEIDTEEVFVIGGAQLYAAALPYTDRLYVTEIDDTKDGDAFFPEYEDLFTKKTAEEPREHEGLKYRWVVLEK